MTETPEPTTDPGELTVPAPDPPPVAEPKTDDDTEPEDTTPERT